LSRGLLSAACGTKDDQLLPALPSSPRLVSLTLHAIPALAVVAVVVSSALSGPSDVVAARVFGGPPDPNGSLAWRVVAQRKYRGWFSPVVGLRVELVVEGHASTQGTTDAEGAWEARLQLPASDANRVRATIRSPALVQPLATDVVALDVPAWRESFHRIEPLVPGRSTGPLLVQVALARGTIAASFPERLIIHVARAMTGPVADAEISLDGEGVAFPAGTTTRTNEHGQAVTTVVMQHHAPRLGVRAKLSPDLISTWEGVLTGPPGAMWLDPAALARGTIRVVSPVRHPAAYLTLFTERARLFGARLVLQPELGGNAVGNMPLPPLPAEDCWVLISPDPQGQGQESAWAAWPVRATTDRPQIPRAAAQQRTPLLLDGMPAVTKTARAQSARARTRALGILAAAAALEALLLAWRSRHARRELEAALSSDMDLNEAVKRALVGGAHFWWKLVLAAMLIAIGFGALALATWMAPL
jgi:hypothetical protein